MMPMTKLLQRSAWLAWALLALSGFGFLFMVMDDKPPFQMLGYEKATVSPGEILRIEASVKRELSRRCSVTFSRHLFDVEGTRIDVVPDTYMPASALEELQRLTPDKLKLAIPIPSYVKPGPATLVVPLAYQCNAWHALRPIETRMVVAFEVVQ